ncbi:MAG: RNA polymerase sigma factor [Planctomycetota bacterium]
MKLSPPVNQPRCAVTDGAALVALLSAARAGRTEAWHELYRRFVRVVHGIALGYVSKDEAEDVTQDVFARAFRELAQVREDAAFPGWLCALARHLAVDAQRRERRRGRTVPLVATHAPVARQAAQSSDAVAETELRERVIAHIRSLTSAYRETLLLRLVEGLTGAEIADRTGLTPESVRVNLSRGLQLLRPLLEKDGMS